MRQQMADRDRTGRGDDLTLGIYGRPGERRDELTHGIPEPDLPFLDEDHRRDARQGLALGRDPKDPVSGHAAACLAVCPADRLLVYHLPVPQHQRYRAGYAVAVHIGLEKRIDTPKPLGRESVIGRRPGLGLGAQGGRQNSPQEQGSKRHGNSHWG